MNFDVNLYENLCEPFTHKTIKRFAHDFKIPIPIFDPQYILYYVDLYDPVYNSKYKYKLLIDVFNKYLGNENLYKKSVEIRESIENRMKANSAYQNFLNSKLIDYNYVLKNQKRDSLFTQENVGKKLLSIDLTKANYQSLRYYSKYIANEPDSKNNLIFGTNNYDDFIKLFIDDAYFLEAKKYREVLFGYMNPKRQQIIQRMLIDKIIRFCLEKELFIKEQVVSYSSDEFVISIDNDHQKLMNNLSIINDFVKKNDIQIHSEIFNIIQLEPYNAYVKKNLITNQVEFKNCDLTLMPQFFKHYFNLKITDNDLLFLASNNQPAKYLESLWKEN